MECFCRFYSEATRSRVASFLRDGSRHHCLSWLLRGTAFQFVLFSSLNSNVLAFNNSRGCRQLTGFHHSYPQLGQTDAAFSRLATSLRARGTWSCHEWPGLGIVRSSAFFAQYIEPLSTQPLMRSLDIGAWWSESHRPLPAGRRACRSCHLPRAFSLDTFRRRVGLYH